MKDMQTEQLLCWSGMTDFTKHSTTSGSNKEQIKLFRYKRQEFTALYQLWKFDLTHPNRQF